MAALIERSLGLANLAERRGSRVDELSGGMRRRLLIALGLAELLPDAWSRITVVTGLGSRSAGGLAAAHRRGGLVGAVLTGAALGPQGLSAAALARRSPVALAFSSSARTTRWARPRPGWPTW